MNLNVRGMSTAQLRVAFRTSTRDSERRAIIAEKRRRDRVRNDNYFRYMRHFRRLGVLA